MLTHQKCCWNERKYIEKIEVAFAKIGKMFTDYNRSITPERTVVERQTMPQPPSTKV